MTTLQERNSPVKSKLVLLQPIITNKSTVLAQSRCFTFEVMPEANKFQIASAFSEQFKARVLNVNIVIDRSHRKRNKRGSYTRRADTKKAYIRAEIDLPHIFPAL